jgi:hypothetical protein
VLLVELLAQTAAMAAPAQIPDLLAVTAHFYTLVAVAGQEAQQVAYMAVDLVELAGKMELLV